MSSISFKASIKIDHQKLQEYLRSDRHFASEENRIKITKVIREIENFSKMKEPSIVKLTPRLDSNQLNIISTVEDASGNIKTTISERSGRRLCDNDDFARRFVSNIQTGIKNVQIAKQEIEKIKDYISQSKSIEDKDFIAKLPSFMLESLKKGNNPTQRILSILKQIEKEFPEQKSNISIKNIKTPARLNKQSRINSFFYVENTTEQKRLPMSLLLKDPAANLFI